MKKKKVLRINLDNTRYQVVRDASDKFGFKVTPEESKDWLVMWMDTGITVDRLFNMKPFQKINHYPGMDEICKKSKLARNLRRLSKFFPQEYNFFPKTWVLPQDRAEFDRYCKEKSLKKRSRKKKLSALSEKWFIAKPSSGSQGKGIYLLRNMDDADEVNALIKQGNTFVVQSYVHRPLLLGGGFKFDLRIYVLVTSCDPLRVYIYKEGLARFATVKYGLPTEKNHKTSYMHLTNYAVNKLNTAAKARQDGCKRSMSSVMSELEGMGHDVTRLWSRITDIILKTIVSIQPQLQNILRTFSRNATETHPEIMTQLGSKCFEVLGFDVIIDETLKPWVLEVNHSPSFTCDSPLDQEVKLGVIHEAFTLLNLKPSLIKKYVKAERRFVQKRLMKATGAVKERSPVESIAKLADSKESSTSTLVEKDADEIERDEEEDEEYAGEDAGEDGDDDTASLVASSGGGYGDDAADTDKQKQKQKKPAADSYDGMYELIFPPRSAEALARYNSFMDKAHVLRVDTKTTVSRKNYITSVAESKKASNDLLAARREAVKTARTGTAASAARARKPGGFRAITSLQQQLQQRRSRFAALVHDASRLRNSDSGSSSSGSQRTLNAGAQEQRLPLSLKVQTLSL